MGVEEEIKLFSFQVKPGKVVYFFASDISISVHHMFSHMGLFCLPVVLDNNHVESISATRSSYHVEFQNVS